MGLQGRPRWQEAVALACRAHDGEMRKDGKTPYVSHPVRVMMTVRDVFGCADEAALCAAVLHDTIEDTPTDYDDIAGAFGEVVADLVAALTKNMTLREGARERDYHERLAAADWRARLVKLGDVFDNWCDVTGTETKTNKLLERCETAIRLASVDRAAHPETARGIEAVERLIMDAKRRGD